jgi:hypothetical protein
MAAEDATECSFDDFSDAVFKVGQDAHLLPPTAL